MTTTRRVWIALGTVYVVWGSTYLGIKVAIETIPPFVMAGTRFLIAGSSRWRSLSAPHRLSSICSL